MSRRRRLPPHGRRRIARACEASSSSISRAVPKIGRSRGQRVSRIRPLEKSALSAHPRGSPIPSVPANACRRSPPQPPQPAKPPVKARSAPPRRAAAAALHPPPQHCRPRRRRRPGASDVFESSQDEDLPVAGAGWAREPTRPARFLSPVRPRWQATEDERRKRLPRSTDELVNWSTGEVVNWSTGEVVHRSTGELVER